MSTCGAVGAGSASTRRRVPRRPRRRASASRRSAGSSMSCRGRCKARIGSREPCRTRPPGSAELARCAQCGAGVGRHARAARSPSRRAPDRRRLLRRRPPARRGRRPAGAGAELARGDRADRDGSGVAGYVDRAPARPRRRACAGARRDERAERRSGARRARAPSGRPTSWTTIPPSAAPSAPPATFAVIDPRRRLGRRCPRRRDVVDRQIAGGGRRREREPGDRPSGPPSPRSSRRAAAAAARA